MMLTQMLKRTQTVRLDIEQLAEAHYDAIWRFCFRRVGQSLAADATQETFLTALKRASSFRGDSDAKTWLFGIALNVCRSAARKVKHDLPLDEIVELQSRDGQPSLNSIRLADALKKLTPEHREAVILHELDGLTYAEIGHIVGVPEGTIKSRMHHAMHALRTHLSPNEDVS